MKQTWQLIRRKGKYGMNSAKRYIRKEIYSIDFVKRKTQDVLFIDRKGKDSEVNFDGDMIYGNSHRYQTFFTKGTKCACCGLEGKYFAKEKCKDVNRYHLNLYGVDENGNEVLMTKDHILPKSKGGRNHLDNYQTMCIRCNMLKGNTTIN